MEEEIFSTFQYNLKKIRTQRRLTQAELAKKSGLNSTVICAFERIGGKRKPSFHNLKKLSEALKCSIDDLVGISKENPDDIDIILMNSIKILSDNDKKFIHDIIKKIMEKH